MQVVDPFAGGGDLLKPFDLPTMGYDIDPALGWTVNDSLRHIPKHPLAICITNPPYLAKNSATRRNLDFHGDYEDLYLQAIDQCLKSFGRVIAIIPESFLMNNFHKGRLRWVNVIEGQMFEDTEHPVLVAAWGERASNDFITYKNGKRIGTWNEITQVIPQPTRNHSIRFNDPEGELGLIACDSTTGKSIRFCHSREITNEVKQTSRHQTRISGITVDDHLLEQLNQVLAGIRSRSGDLVLAPFMGNTTAGERRRRLDFKLARAIINEVLR